MHALNYKYEALNYKFKKGIKVDVLRDEHFQTMVKSNIDPEVELRVKRTGAKDLQEIVVSESFNKIKVLQRVSDEKRLAQQNFNTQKKLGRQRGRARTKKLAGKILNKVGKGVETATTGLSFAQGGIDAAAGSDIIQKARDLRAKGFITEGDYNEMIGNGRLRIAQGSFGIASGLKDVAKFVGKRVEKNIWKKAGNAGIQLLKQAKRFGSFIGGAISIGTGVTSMAKNAIAATDAAKQGIVGKAVMYGVMAAVDGITVILDGVSVALDFIFPPLGPVVDLVSTILQVVNTILGFFADLIDFRTAAERVRDDFKTYVNSEAFKTYVNNLAEEYKKRGFDIFKYYVDAEVAGIKADKATLQAERKTITMSLTDKARADFNDTQLRVALLDTTSSGKTLHGRANDDEIVAGFGPDCIYGEEGDDILFGRGGSDTIYGGPGNDYLNGGTGRDTLLGGTGDDVLVCEPSVDKKCKGEEGEDTLVLSGKPLMFKEDLWNKNYVTLGPEWEVMTSTHPSRISPVKGIYLDIGYTSGSGSNVKQGRSGINLGSCFPGWPDGYNKFLHKPAFLSWNDNLEQKFVDLFNSKNPVSLNNAQEIRSKMLWFMAEKKGVKYFCDGTSFYAVSTSSIRVARNAIDSIHKGYAYYKDGHLLFSGGWKVEALLVFAFRRSFVFDKFEKISAARPDNLQILSHYIPTTVIGSAEHNVIDLAYGIGDVVYTGEGNNVISVGSAIGDYYYTDKTAEENPGALYSGLYNWAKCIVGGSGDNTLVIQYMGVYGHWQLRNIDSPFDTESDYDASIVYLKNIPTVEVRNADPRMFRTPISINAEQYDGARRYILNNTISFHGPLSTEKDVIVLPRRLSGCREIVFGKNTKNTISFKYYEDEEFPIVTIDIYQENDYDQGKIICKEKGRLLRNLRGVWLKNAMNVISFSTCSKIIGSDKENLLIAVGGQTSIEAKDGDDTLVSTRGRHELIGGPGSDTYVLHGPDVVDYLTISVIMGEDGRIIRCKTTIYGEWKEEERRLHIEVLKDDHADVLLKTVEIVPAQGDQGKNLGIISKDSTNRKLIFEPGSNFDYLKRNAAKVVRVKFTTTGSSATIKEDDSGNQLRFESITSLDGLTASVENNFLVFKYKTNPPRTALIDHEWGNKLITRTLTNLLDLIIDFAQRFPLILFRKNDQEFDRVTSKDIIKFLYKYLKHLETAPGQEFDTILDSTSLPSNVGAEIDVGNGQNIVLAKTRGKTYKLGAHSSGSIIVANKFIQGTGKVTIKGEYDWLWESHIAVVVGVGSGGVVEICTGPHDVIITGALLSEVEVSRDNDVVHLKDSKQRDLIAGWSFGFCKNLIFKKSTTTDEYTQIIFNCGRYIRDQLLPPDIQYKPTIVSYDSDRSLKLNCPFTKDSAVIILSPTRETLHIYVNKLGRGDYAENYQYLVVPSDDVRSYDAKMVVDAIRTRFKAGIEFSDGLVKEAEICSFVVGKIKRAQVLHPARFWLRNEDMKC